MHSFMKGLNPSVLLPHQSCNVMVCVLNISVSQEDDEFDIVVSVQTYFKPISVLPDGQLTCTVISLCSQGCEVFSV